MTDAANPPPLEDLDRSRRLFAHTMRDAPVEVLVAVIRDRCREGHGLWQEPTPASTHARPATHLYEIAFLGQTATGTTPEEAARNWRTCALKQIEDAA